MAHNTRCTAYLPGFVLCMLVLVPARADALWNFGMYVSTNSNVYQSVDDDETDQYASPSITYSWPDNMGKGLNWTFDAVFEGCVYRKEADLNMLSLSLSPGIMYILTPTVSGSLTPFIQGEAVNDSDQSAYAYGGTAALNWELFQLFSASAYYRYEDSHAREDVYSSSENNLGCTLGMSLTQSWFCQAGYEYGHGTAYQTQRYFNLAEISRRFRHVYLPRSDRVVVRDDQNTHTVSAGVGYAWTEAVITEMSYTYEKVDSHLDAYSSQEATVGVSYRY